MLTHLTINNFMLIDHLDLPLQQGMTAITGETGTGKSVLLGALALALGERADGDKVRRDANRADITATFLLDDLPEARQWLIEHDLCHADECLLRRIVASDGRSRAFINSQPVTLQQVKALGELLIDIHSQHAHQALLVKNHHQKLLDAFAGNQLLAETVSDHYKQWQQLLKRYRDLRDNAEAMHARYQLLRYQVEELDALALQPGELQELEQEQQTLSNADTMINKSQQIIELCNNDDVSLNQLLHQAISLLQGIRPQTEDFAGAQELLSNALIQVDEARHLLDLQLGRIDIDPERLQAVEQRLSIAYDLARKHHVKPEELPELHERLIEELSQLAVGDDTLAELEQQSQVAEQQFVQQAQQLSERRQQAASQLGECINNHIQQLAMAHANFTVVVNRNTEKATATGFDDIEFLISTNPGQPHKPLSKVVSGGELSRISLAIQMATAETANVATLVFDEVDVGIGGATADVVGKFLATLGKHSQVLCVTHLAQVASKAQQHWQVCKQTADNSAATEIIELDNHTKIEEIARMISGDVLSDESIAHARLMLEKAAG